MGSRPISCGDCSTPRRPRSRARRPVANGIEIVSIQDQPAYDNLGHLVRFRIVVYKVDGHGPLGIHGTADELTMAQISRRIPADAAQPRSLTRGLKTPDPV